jgi:hypothetical protein
MVNRESTPPKQTRSLVNDIGQCVAQAKHLNIRHPYKRIFCKLAGDETTGLIAYAIWRGRSQLISTLNRASDHKLSEASTSRASQARSYWQGEHAAQDDLPRPRRPGR